VEDQELGKTAICEEDLKDCVKRGTKLQKYPKIRLNWGSLWILYTVYFNWM
jgi:hypothetical protein